MFTYVVASVLIISLISFTGCKGADSGFAPGGITSPSAEEPTSNSTNHIKYGETITTSNGWTVSHDNADPIESKELSNGWKIEVKYE